MKKLLVLAVLFAAKSFAGDVVEFHIPAGTGKQPWNAEDKPIKAKLGDTIRFFNDDSVNHQLHTNGAPCAHGPVVAPGKTWDCVASKTFSSKAAGSLYDHGFGMKAAVWIEVAAANADELAAAPSKLDCQMFVGKDEPAGNFEMTVDQAGKKTDLLTKTKKAGVTVAAEKYQLNTILRNGDPLKIPLHISLFYKQADRAASKILTFHSELTMMNSKNYAGRTYIEYFDDTYTYLSTRCTRSL